MENNKYPVKYALLPVKARREGKNGNDFYIVECYIISKVYVMEEHRHYREDGNYNASYKILFPFLAYSYGISKERIPSDFLFKNREEHVTYLYDSLEEAQAEKDKRNVLVSEKVVEKYKPLEDEILELTKDLIVETEENAKVRRKK